MQQQGVSGLLLRLECAARFVYTPRSPRRGDGGFHLVRSGQDVFRELPADDFRSANAHRAG